ncbi:tetratricopeptide repeat protein [Synechococcus sp. CC9616]|uniref:tetratricopeptide repeat protein n=1 Tax=Synechococcus sp. CC9616 TaxID=110663 RepID=UPI0004BCD448|nr:tetratricopeptide repeat protein [Synechococcus sp. CC9616]
MKTLSNIITRNQKSVIATHTACLLKIKHTDSRAKKLRTSHKQDNKRQIARGFSPGHALIDINLLRARYTPPQSAMAGFLLINLMEKKKSMQNKRLKAARETMSVCSSRMSRSTTAFTAAFSLLLPTGPCFVIGLTPFAVTGTALLSAQTAYAQSAEDWNESGNAKFREGDYQGAIADYTKAIKINPRFGLAYYNRGFAKEYSGDSKGAILDYTKAIELNPDDANAYANRGDLKYDMDDNPGAIADYDKSLVINPLNRRAYAYRGMAKSDLKNYQGALADFDKAIELDPDYGFAYFMRAYVKSDLNDYKGALADFDKAIEVEPLNELNYSSRGLLKEMNGDLSGACSDWKKAVELGHDDAVKWVRNQC